MQASEGPAVLSVMDNDALVLSSASQQDAEKVSCAHNPLLGHNNTFMRGKAATH